MTEERGCDEISPKTTLKIHKIHATKEKIEFKLINFNQWNILFNENNLKIYSFQCRKKREYATTEI